ncbi:MAG: PadR family transcriptional regulator [Coriobacteriales bacterium]|jgi:DNA-binding PadR family transcriptional regulator
MWSGCSPKTDDDLKECAELGKNLSRMSQPTILAILAEAGMPLHGYRIVKLAAGSPMFGGNKPDATGIYRALKKMEEQGLVTAEWETPETGAAKRLFELTDKGRKCLRRWIDALACYTLTIQELRDMASSALGIETPETPVCGHLEVESENFEAEPKEA